jgi:hypothetical protein
MQSHYILGAINASTNCYIIPSLASKSETYKCPDCDKPVILRKGEIRKAHFAHKAYESTCIYYDRPGESQIHKDAKLRLQFLLNAGYKLKIGYRCDGNRFTEFKSHLEYETYSLESGDSVVLEYRDIKGKYVADFAIINSNEPRIVLEVCNTHKTVTPRPEPWFEINAYDIINYDVNDNLVKQIYFTCRRGRSSECKSCFAYEYKLGALDKSTNGYCLPKEIYSDNECICLDCKQPVNLIKGFYKHQKNTCCKMYNYPSDQQIIKDTLYKLVQIFQTTTIKHVSNGTCQFYTWAYDDNDDHCSNEMPYNIDSKDDDIYKINFKTNTLSIYSNDNIVKYRFKIVANNTDIPFENEPNLFYINIYNVILPIRWIINWDKLDHFYISNNNEDEICSTCSKIKENLPKLEKVERLFNPKCKHSDIYLQNTPCVQCNNIEYIPVSYKGFRSICRDCTADLKESTLTHKFQGVADE